MIILEFVRETKGERTRIDRLVSIDEKYRSNISGVPLKVVYILYALY
jgi:hypothetical protein